MSKLLDVSHGQGLLCASSLLNYLMQLLLFISSMCRQALQQSAETIFWEEF